MNLTLYAITAFIILDTDGNRVLSKYYRQEHNPSSKGLANTKEQRTFEKGLWQKTKKSGGAFTAILLLPPIALVTDFGLLVFSDLPVVFSGSILRRIGDIILYDGRLAVYKHSLDLIFYLIANQDENELMISTALSAFSDAVHMLLRNQVEKRAVLENLDLVLLCLDETIDEGCVTQSPSPAPPLQTLLRFLSICCELTTSLFVSRSQYHRGNGFNDDSFTSQPAKSRYDRDRHQRTDNHERLPDDEGEDVSTDCCRILEVPHHLPYDGLRLQTTHG